MQKEDFLKFLVDATNTSIEKASRFYLLFTATLRNENDVTLLNPEKIPHWNNFPTCYERVSKDGERIVLISPFVMTDKEAFAAIYNFANQNNIELEL